MNGTVQVEGGVRLGLALQGGGSHGAFGWGVLHELLGSKAVEVAAISGTSAGAVNAVIYADGWLDNSVDPRRGAQEALARFWRLNAAAAPGFLRPAPLDAVRGDPTLKNNPMFLGLDLAARLFSQYELGCRREPAVSAARAQLRPRPHSAARPASTACLSHRHRGCDRRGRGLRQQRAHPQHGPGLGLPADAGPGVQDQGPADVGRRL